MTIAGGASMNEPIEDDFEDFNLLECHFCTEKILRATRYVEAKVNHKFHLKDGTTSWSKARMREYHPACFERFVRLRGRRNSNTEYAVHSHEVTIQLRGCGSK